MSLDFTLWHYGLLFSSLCVLLGTIGFASAQDADNRRMTGGLLTQGIMLLLVVGSQYFHDNSQLRLVALALAILLAIRSCGGQSAVAKEPDSLTEESR